METRVGNTPDVAEPAVITQAPAEPAILDPPGSPAEQEKPVSSGKKVRIIHISAAEELTPHEQQQYETLVKGFRDAQRIYNAPARYEAFKELLDTLETKGDLEGLWSEYHRMEQTLHPIACMKASPKVIGRALRAMIAETRETLDPVDELKAMEPAIRAVIDRLGPRVKAIIGVLVDLNGLEGLSVGVDFGNVIVNQELSDSDAIEQGLKDFAEDPDVQVMAKAYALASQIEEAEHDR